MKKLRVGLVQMQVVESKKDNLTKAEEMIKRAATSGASLAILPEMFNCPYSTDNFPLYAEQEGDATWQFLSKCSRENRLYLVGGSIPELDDGKVFNTSYIFDPQGRQIGKHRKMHLFDIDIEGGQYFKESDILSPGNSAEVIETTFGEAGVMICYDIRFPELARLMVLKGAKFIIVPGAFNMTTGPAHWEILFRTRALDNQVYTLGCAPARNNLAGYVSYGNSIVVDPWGIVIGRLGEEEDVLLADLDFEKLNKVRKELPLLQHTRRDVYTLQECKLTK